ncbi:MAG: RDD family protein [Acidimicrobiales bacterium]
MSDGWHDDPLGRYQKRYYDGSQWTHHVTDGSGQSFVDPSGTQPTTGPGASSPVGTMPSFPATDRSAIGPERGNAWLRFLARIIDLLLVSVPLYFVLDPLFDIGRVESVNTPNETSFNVSLDYPGPAIAIQVAVWALYEIVLTGRFGRTVGKMICGLTVVRASDASLPGLGLAALRFVVGLGYAIPVAGQIAWVVSAVKGFSDPQGRTLHDLGASTAVVTSSSL